MRVALLLAAVLTLPAATCRSALSLRDAQDEYNAGVALLARPAPPVDAKAMQFGLDSEPRLRFQAALDILEEAELLSGSRPGHLRLAALTLQGYCHYALYRLKAGDDHFAAALAAIKLGPSFYEAVDDPKKPIVLREQGMLAMLRPLLRMEYAFQKFEDRRRGPDAMAAAGEAYEVYRSVLDECVELSLPRGSPVAGDFVVIALDAVQAACEAYSQSKSWGALDEAETQKRRKEIELRILGRALVLVKGYASGSKPALPADFAALPALAPKFGPEHQAVKTRWSQLRTRVESLFTVPYRSDLVWEAAP